MAWLDSRKEMKYLAAFVTVLEPKWLQGRSHHRHESDVTKQKIRRSYFVFKILV